MVKNQSFQLEAVDYSTLIKISLSNIGELSAALEKYQALHAAYNEMADVITHDVLDNREQLTQINISLENLLQYSSDFRTLNDLITKRNTLLECKKYLESKQETLEQIGACFSANLSPFFNLTSKGLQEFIVLADVAFQLPAELISERENVFDDERLDAILPMFVDDVSKLSALEQRVSQVFDFERLPDSKALQSYKTDVTNGGLFKWFSKTWRMAKNAVKGIAVAPKASLSELTAALDDAILYKSLQQRIEASPDYFPLLKRYYQGAQTDARKLQTLRQWYTSVRLEYGIGFGKLI